MKLKIGEKVLFGFVIFAFLVFAGYIIYNRNDVPALKVVGNDYSSGDKIIVELTGEVNKCGKYAVPVGTTVHDVIYMAGGITDDGDPDSVELGKYLTDDCSVNVAKAVRYDARVTRVISYSPQNRCNINTATLSMLAALPGIGEGIAADIINYREVYGSFKDIYAITNVSGIGEKKFEKIKDLITVGGK